MVLCCSLSRGSTAKVLGNFENDLPIDLLLRVHVDKGRLGSSLVVLHDDDTGPDRYRDLTVVCRINKRNIQNVMRVHALTGEIMTFQMYECYAGKR